MTLSIYIPNQTRLVLLIILLLHNNNEHYKYLGCDIVVILNHFLLYMEM